MRVFLAARLDNGQQNHLLAKAMRDYLGWDAKSLVMNESYLGYKTDWTAKDNLDEAREFAKEADLFVFQDMLIDVFDEMKNEVKDKCGLLKSTGIKNTIINGTGTLMRDNINVLLNMQLEGWAVVPPISDETIAGRLLPAPFENVIVPVEKIRELTDGIQKNKTISVCHAPTKKELKGTELVESILKPLDEAGVIQYVPIRNMAWREALKAKAACNMIVDSIGQEMPGEPKFPATYGAGNALEGLVLGQTVVSRISPWAYALHPDLPITTTWGGDAKDVIEGTITMASEMNGCDALDIVQERGKKWVSDNFAAENQIEKWAKYIEWVMSR